MQPLCEDGVAHKHATMQTLVLKELFQDAFVIPGRPISLIDPA